MLKSESIERLAGLAKVDVEAFKNAITSDEEVDLSIPGGVKVFTEDELKQYTSNAIEEVKPAIQTAAQEVAFKEAGRKIGLDKTVRSIDDLLTHYEQKVVEKHKLEPSKYKEQIEEKDRLINEKLNELEQLKSVFEDFKVKSSIKSKVLAHLGESELLTKEERLTLFETKYDIKQNDGKLEVVDKATGIVLKDALKNPLPIDAIVKDFDKKYVSTSGGGTPPPQSGGSGAKLTPAEARKILEGKGFAYGTREYYSEYSKLLK